MKLKKILNIFATIFFMVLIVGFGYIQVKAQKLQTAKQDEKLIELAKNLNISDGPIDIQCYKVFRNTPNPYEINLERKAFIPGEKVNLSFSLPDKVELKGKAFKVGFSLIDLDGKKLNDIGTLIINKIDDIKSTRIQWKVPDLPDDEYLFAAQFYDSEGECFFSRSDIVFISSEYQRIHNETKKKVSEAANSKRDNNWLLKEVSLPSVEMIIKDAEIRWATFRKKNEDYYDIKQMLNKAVEYAEILKKGKDPFEGIIGPFIKAYRSELDNSLQPYAIYIPENYNPSVSYPLVIGLHGAWSNHTNLLNRMFGMPNRPGENDEESIKSFRKMKSVDYIVVNPFGRGLINGYSTGIGEQDVLKVLDIVRKTYNVDQNRIYLTGLSMGGGGTWSIGLRYPDLFAAIYPVCGPAIFLPFPGTPYETYDIKISQINAPINIAENALNLPVKIFHGAMDDAVSVEHSRSIVKRFKELGYYGKNVWYAEFPGVDHWVWVEAYRNGREFEWFKQFKRDPYPRHLIYKTCNSKYNKSFWVQIDEFSKIRELASIKGKIKGQNIEIKVQNVERYSLILNDSLLDTKNEINVITNGFKTYEGKLPKEGELSFSILNNQTSENRKYGIDTSKFKRRVLPDISEFTLFQRRSAAQLGRHIYVYGSKGNAEQTRFLKEAATKMADWGQRIWVKWEVKKDTEVTEEDIKQSNIILFGSPESNSILARINKNLPIRFVKDMIIKGDEKIPGKDKSFRLTYFNPENNSRYIEVYGAQTKIGIDNLLHLPQTNPDYIILNEDGTKLIAGLFDKNWDFEN